MKELDAIRDPVQLQLGQAGFVVRNVLTYLRYNDLGLLTILGGRKVMLESPLIDELVMEKYGDLLTEKTREAAREAARETACETAHRDISRSSN